MKTKMALISLLLSMAMVQTTNGQFLNNLKKKVEQRVEQTVINKTANKAAETASSSMDKVFDSNFWGAGKMGNKITPKNIPSNFDFEYTYQLTVSTSEGNMKMDYLLKPGASYLGMKMDMGSQMFMVMDGGENLNYMFMESGGNKIVTVTALDVSEIINGNDEGMNNLENYTITKLPNKTYLGFDCEGIQMENDAYVFVMYYTNEAEISFNDVFKTDQGRIPIALQSHFKENQNALMLFMDMKDKMKKGKKNTSGTMECTLLEASNFNFSTIGYQPI